jgi:uncharacterized membrane protein YhiD involved in acid resistance
VEAAIGMAAGGGFYGVAGAATGIVLFALVVLGWGATKLNLKARIMIFRFTTSHADSVSTEVQRLMASLRIPMSHFRVSMSGQNSTVEFEADVSLRQHEEILAQLHRQGVVAEVLPLEGRHE